MSKEITPIPPEGQVSQSAAAGRRAAGNFCARCGALLPEGVAACLVCGTKRGAPPPPSTPAAEEPAAQPLRPVARKSLEIWRRWVVGLSSVLLLLIVSLAGLGVYRQYFDTSSYRAGEVVVYQSASGQLMLSYPGLEQPQQIAGISPVGKDSAQGEVRASANGRWLAYVQDGGGLYLIDLAQQRAAGSNSLAATKVADGAVAQSVRFATSSEYLVYLTGNKELFASDFSESWRLDSGVTDVVEVDQRRVLYTRQGDNSNDGQVDLYLDYLGRDGGEWLLIDRDVAQVLDWTPGFEQLLYTCVRQNESGRDVVWLNSFELRRNSSTQLVGGLGPVLDASAEKGTVAYLVPTHPDWDYEQFIDDDMAEEDTLVQKPDMADYPLLTEAISIYGEAGDFSDIQDNEDLAEEQRLYNELTLLWDEKQERDVLRMFYHNEFTRAQEYAELYDLYVWRGGAEYQLDSGIWLQEPLTKARGQVDANKNFVMYQRIDPASLQRMKISELWEAAAFASFYPDEYFFAHTQQELRFSLLDGVPSRIYTRTGNLSPKQWRVAPKADGIYFSVGEMDGGSPEADELYFATVKNGVVDGAVRVGQQAGSLGRAFREGVLFHKPNHSGLDLYRNGILRELGGQSSQVASLENDGTALIYYKDCSGGVGSLYLLQREERFIAQDVLLDWKPWYRNDSLLYYATPGTKTGAVDLHLWRDGKTQLVQEDVQSVLRFPQLKSVGGVE